MPFRHNAVVVAGLERARLKVIAARVAAVNDDEQAARVAVADALEAVTAVSELVQKLQESDAAKATLEAINAKG